MGSVFIDKVKIIAKGGDGGRGCVSFRRESGVPRGGPNGGNGGVGGSVILLGDSGLLTLLDFSYKPQLKAKRGAHGKGKDCDGKSGEDIIVKVPLGTIVKDLDNNKILGEILNQDQQLIIACGGRGGRGNKQFASSTNRAPKRAEPGEAGELKKLELELKLIAGIGLVGAPNAGKSTLINYISTTNSKVASYPFTTLNPVLGVVNLDNDSRIVVADTPGLVLAQRGVKVGEILSCVCDGNGQRVAQPLDLREECLVVLDQHLLLERVRTRVRQVDHESNTTGHEFLSDGCAAGEVGQDEYLDRGIVRANDVHDLGQLWMQRRLPAHKRDRLRRLAPIDAEETAERVDSPGTHPFGWPVSIRALEAVGTSPVTAIRDAQ